MIEKVDPIAIGHQRPLEECRGSRHEIHSRSFHRERNGPNSCQSDNSSLRFVDQKSENASGPRNGEKVTYAVLSGEIDCRLERLEEMLNAFQDILCAISQRLDDMQGQLKGPQTSRNWYSVAEAAELMGRAEFTVREWCRLGRISAQKRECGRGGKREWMISQKELERTRDKGLLPTNL